MEQSSQPFTHQSPFAKSQFAKRNYFLAGATSGIGFAVAEQLASHGAHLTIASRNLETLLETKNILEKKGASSCRLCVLDFAKNEIFEQLSKGFAKLTRESISHEEMMYDGVLLNGGGPHGGKFSSLKEENFDDAHNLLLKGPALLLKFLLPHLNANSSVVSVTSTTVKEPHPDLPLSACYRTGLVALLKSASDELAPKGIRINNVAPGYTATARLEELKTYVASNSGLTESEVEKQWARLAPQNRVADPLEIANTVLFLLSSASSFCTGQTLIVDGGQTRGYN